jgi:nucleoside-diphosphate-sugar epimerase
MSKSILILGGTGFLGKKLTILLKKNNYQVVSTGSELDILNKNLLVKNLSEKHFDYLINATGQKTNPIKNCQLQNTKGIQNLISLQKQFNFHLIHISSLLTLKPESDYAKLKLKAESIIKANLSSKKFLIIRLSNLYGPNQKKGLISYLINQINNRQYSFSFSDNDGSLTRYFLHINDASNNIVKMINSQLVGIHNLSGPEKYSLKQLITALDKIVAHKISATYSLKKPLDNIDTEFEASGLTYEHNLKDYLTKSIKA